MIPYVLIFLAWGTSTFGFTAEFECQASCEAARTTIAQTTAGFKGVIPKTMCVPKR